MDISYKDVSINTNELELMAESNIQEMINVTKIKKRKFINPLRLKKHNFYESSDLKKNNNKQENLLKYSLDNKIDRFIIENTKGDFHFDVLNNHKNKISNENHANENSELENLDFTKDESKNTLMKTDRNNELGNSKIVIKDSGRRLSNLQNKLITNRSTTSLISVNSSNHSLNIKNFCRNKKVDQKKINLAKSLILEEDINFSDKINVWKEKNAFVSLANQPDSTSNKLKNKILQETLFDIETKFPTLHFNKKNQLDFHDDCSNKCERILAKVVKKFRENIKKPTSYRKKKMLSQLKFLKNG